MTNFKKSFGVMAFGLLALAFCCVLIAQSAMAREEGSVTEATPYYEQGTVPLPGIDDVAVVKQAVKAPRSEAPAELLDGVTKEDVASRMPLALPSTLSTMQGGEDIASAAVIPSGTLPTTLTGTTEGYADDYADPCGYDGTSPDVVYSYTPTVDEWVNFNMCESAYDTKLWVVEATGMTVVACNDDGPDCLNWQSQIDIVAMAAGETYYIVIGGYYYPEDAGEYQLDLALYTYGDECLAAQAITQVIDPEDPLTHTASWDVDLSTTTCGGWSAVGFLNTWHFIYTATEPGLYEFTFTDDGDPVNSIIGIEGNYECGEGAYCLDYGFEPGSYMCAAVLMPGWTYRFAIGSGHPALESCPRTFTTTGTVVMNWTELMAMNDECVDAEDLGVGSATHFVHNVQATLSPDFDYTWCDPVIDPGTQTCGDVWYTWEASQTGYVLFDMCDWGESNFDSKMFVYRGYSCAGTETIDPHGCSDDGCGAFGDGGLIELECTAGEVFMIRLAGWISGDGPPDATCLAEGAMGTGYLDIWEDVVSIRPYNDDCPDAVVGVLAPGGDVYTTVNNLAYSGWGSCPDLYNMPDGSIGPGGAMAWMVFDAFSFSECTDIRIDYCGSADDPGRVNYTNWPQGVNIFTGCPCEGPFVTIPTSGGTYTGVCDPLIYTDTDFDFSRGWDYLGLLPGTYYAPTSNWHLGVSSVSGYYIYPHDFNFNVRSTPVECEYCEAFSNINSCPPVAGASWILNVDLAEINKDPVSPPEDDCLAYEDHTDMVAYLYKGISYDLTVIMGKVGVAGVHDSCDAWIDWNQNSGFAAFVPEINEKIDLERLALTWTGTVTPPLDAYGPGEGATGVTMMRVRMASDADGANVPCGEKVWGEVEDFMVEVTELECGDFGTDGFVDADDIAFLRDYYFGGAAPDYWQRADIDGDGVITLADVIALVDAVYHGGDLICIM